MWFCENQFYITTETRSLTQQNLVYFVLQLFLHYFLSAFLQELNLLILKQLSRSMPQNPIRLISQIAVVSLDAEFILPLEHAKDNAI